MKDLDPQAPVGPSSGRTTASFVLRCGNFFFRYRDALSPAVVLTLLILTRPLRPFGSDAADRVLDGVGLFLGCAGEALRIAVIGYAYIVRGGRARRVYAEDLVTAGFFAVSRNPLYLGNLLVYAGLAVIWNNPWMYVVAGSFFLFLYHSIVAAEEDFLHAKFGATYEQYCRDVARWIPNLGRLSAALEGMSFSWRRVVIREYGTIAAWGLTASMLLIVETLRFRSYAGHEREICGLVGLMVLVIFLWAVARRLKLSRRLTA